MSQFSEIEISKCTSLGSHFQNSFGYFWMHLKSPTRPGSVVMQHQLTKLHFCCMETQTSAFSEINDYVFTVVIGGCPNCAVVIYWIHASSKGSVAARSYSNNLTVPLKTNNWLTCRQQKPVPLSAAAELLVDSSRCCYHSCLWGFLLVPVFLSHFELLRGLFLLLY